MGKITQTEIETFIKFPHIFGQWLGYDLLSDIHSKWIIDCWTTQKDYSMQAHRNSYKTTAVLVVGCVWWLTFSNPNEVIFIIRKTENEASSVVKEIRQHFESEKLRYLYYDVLGVKKIEGKPWGNLSLTISTKNKITKEPSISCMAVTKGITGSHATKIFTDDIITLKDRISKAERKITDNFVRELTNIITVDGVTVNTGTPWHPEDSWRLLPEPVKYPAGSIQIKGFTPEKLTEYKKKLGASLYSANYELKHVADENRIFTDPNYRIWPEHIRISKAWLDPAYDGDCTTALSMIAIDINGIPYVRGWIWPKNVVDIYQDIVNKLLQYRCGTLYVESNADKGASKRDISRLYPSVVDRNESMNKHVKIIAYLKHLWTGLYFAEDCQPDYMNQILDYTEDADLNDAPDSLAALIREMKLAGSNIMDRF